MVAPAPDSLVVATIAGVPFDSAKRLMETSAQMSRSKAVVLKKEQRTAAKNDCWEDNVGERGLREETKQKKGI